MKTYNAKRMLGAICAALLCQSLAYADEVSMQLDSGAWQTLEYKSIPANTITQKADGIHIAVNQSASPLIYVFNSPQALKQIQVSGKMMGLPAIPDDKNQGDKGADDFPFRIGLVLQGDKTLGIAEKLFAADWVKTLFSLAPEEVGIDQVHFLSLSNNGMETFTERVHPASKGLFKESIVGTVSGEEDFILNHQFATPIRVLALWISSDGDDTLSSFALSLKRISFN